MSEWEGKDEASNEVPEMQTSPEMSYAANEMDAHTASPRELAAPVAQTERIVAIDALRGFALLGILIMNIRMMAGPFAQYGNPFAIPAAGGEERSNWLVFSIAHVLADMKMMTIFSMLFGAGIVIMAERQLAKGLGSIGLHYRRMWWLLVIGLIHAYLIWPGDILVIYAVCGAIVFCAWRFYIPVQIVLGAFLLLCGIGLNLGAGLTLDDWPPEAVDQMTRDWAPPPDVVEEQIAAYTGPIAGRLAEQGRMSLGWHTGGFVFFGFWRAAGLMLVGMGLYRLGVFSAKRSYRFYIGLTAIGVAIGLPLILWGLNRNLDDGFIFETAFFLNGQFNYVGSLFIAMAWTGVIMLLVKLGAVKLLISALSAVGQMALTNYLMQSIICTTIFYGHGLGLFGEFTYLQQFYVVLGVWAVELIWSPVWLKHFRFGPFEWLWRSMTYLNLQPMRRIESAA